jgi:thiamine biosynthesis lipoprotein
MRFALFAALFASAALGGEELQRFAYEKAEMGLPFRITLYAADEKSAKAAADAAFERIAQLNEVLSDYDPDSELSRVSRTHDEEIPVSTDLWIVLERAQAMSAQSDGAFDVTVGPLVNLWRRARRKKELPSPELIAEMRARVGWRYLQLNPEKRSVRLLKPDMRLDCGSIGKAYAVDEALKLLRSRGLSRALVGGAGDMAAGDPPPDQDGWKIEAAPLDAPDAPKGEIVLLNNSAIATSGDVFQHVELNGIRYSHIVDPWTGLGLTDHSLVTILARDCLTANSLSTTVSILGPKRGMRLIEDTPGAAGRILRKPSDSIEVLHSTRWPVMRPAFEGGKR